MIKYIIGGGDNGDKDNAMFHYANDYKLAYDEMKKLYEQAFDEFTAPMDFSNFKEEDPLNLRLAGPMVVMLALSCELILKAILNKEKGSFPYTHKLFDLYKEINEKHKAIIEFDVGNSLYSAFPNKNFDFQMLLNEHSEKFVKWRYAHEKIDNVNLIFLESFQNELFSIYQVRKTKYNENAIE